MKNTIKYLFVPAVALLITAYIFSFINKNDEGSSEEVTTESRVLIGGDFELINADGKQIKTKDYRGKLMLVYFGFTNCPMICPTDLGAMSMALEGLGDGLDEVQPIFVTIDPERDKIEQMKTYMSNFHPKIEALTGAPEQIAKAANAYKVYYKKVEGEELSEYLMNHSAYMYLMDRDGNYITHFRHEQPVDEIIEGIKRHI